MKLIYILLVCMLLGSSCEDPDPYGFYQEPRIEITGNRTEFEVRYSNSAGQSGVTLTGSVRPGGMVPIDMNDSFMKYEIVSNDSSFGFIEMHYYISPIIDKSRDALNLMFDSSWFVVDDRLKLFRNIILTDTVERLHNYNGGLNSIHVSF